MDNVALLGGSQRSTESLSPFSRGSWIIALLVLVNIGLFVTLFLVDATYSAILSPGILAYTYGLRCISCCRILSQ